jgi:hypothetical protein
LEINIKLKRLTVIEDGKIIYKIFIKITSKNKRIGVPNINKPKPNIDWIIDSKKISIK